ncbi:acid protease [Xylaria bambusicola]|uniref:acid protease n=1 Tax=Xylaria bambusicola TaxID=326684 RepID=UPI002007FE2F|nr:acid protease [Xylaria bambusicola]KAI0513098.1 acid protease [Xylaria bambusicola]
MIFVLFLAFAALGIAARNGGRSLRLPIRSRDSSTLETRDGQDYGIEPLKANATQKHYLSPYTVELTIGTPPQHVYPAIDLFGTSVWVNPDCFAAYDYEACCKNGEYNSAASSSAILQDCSQSWSFVTPYGEAAGCNVIDIVQFAGAELGYILFGVANSSWKQTAGRLGLGFGCDSGDHTSILDRLKALDLIATRQFSIALGSANPNSEDLDESTDVDVGLGELLFSGINTRKYTGDLRKLRSHPAPNDDPRYYITLTSIGYSNPSNCESFDGFPPPRHAFLDYTTIFTYFPSEYIDMLNGFFPYVYYNITSGLYQVPCYHRSLAASVDFSFGSLIISVPLHDFILQVDGICFLGVQQSVTDDEVILGQSFLRGAYTAFDLDDEAMYMAQYENCGDEVIDWDESASEEDGLCAGKPTTFPASCYATSTTSTSSASSSTSTSCSTTSTSSSTHSTTRHSTKSTTHSTTSTSHSTTHYPTRTSTHSTTSSTTTSRTTSSKTTSTSKTSTHYSTRTTTSSSSTRHSTKTTSSKKTSYTRSSLSTGTGYPTTITTTTSTSPWSSGLSSGVSVGSSTFWTPGYSTGVSWSNISFTATPGSTYRTPTGPSSPSTFVPTTDYATETSTVTSIPASTSHQHRSSTIGSSTPSISIEDSAEQKTVTVTVGVLTSTVYMPSPITIPMSTCDCTGTVMRGGEGGGGGVEGGV